MRLIAMTLLDTEMNDTALQTSTALNARYLPGLGIKLDKA